MPKPRSSLPIGLAVHHSELYGYERVIQQLDPTPCPGYRMFRSPTVPVPVNAGHQRSYPACSNKDKNHSWGLVVVGAMKTGVLMATSAVTSEGQVAAVALGCGTSLLLIASVLGSITLTGTGARSSHSSRLTSAFCLTIPPGLFSHTIIGLLIENQAPSLLIKFFITAPALQQVIGHLTSHPLQIN